MRKQLLGGCLIAGLLVLVSSAPLLGQMKEKSLYERLGKKKAIAAVVDEFVSRVAADNRINKFFAATAGDLSPEPSALSPQPLLNSNSRLQ